VAAAGLGVSGILAASVVGAVFVLFAGCVRLDQVYEDLDWGVVFLLAGTIPPGLAVEESGTAAWLGDALMVPVDGCGPVVVVAVLYGFTSLLTEVMSNNAAAIVLTPIVLQLATRLEMNPYALLVTVMFGASAAFMSPMGYQTNTMVCGPGGYKFTDYV